MTNNSARAVHFLLALFVMLLDRWTKHLVALRISMYDHIQIIPGFFRITHTENTGAAFSLFADSPSHWKTAMLISFSVVAMIVVSILLWKQSRADDDRNCTFADPRRRCRKLMDRVASGRVVDFWMSTTRVIIGLSSIWPTARSSSEQACSCWKLFSAHPRPPRTHRKAPASGT
jgi:signal peptidase II